MTETQVAIIGGGPAGLMTALQLVRYRIPCLLLEGEGLGGLLHNANLVENYPGFPGGIPGAELVQLFTRQASQAGVVATMESALRLERDGELFRIQTESGQHRARIVVLATGTRPLCFPAGFVPAEARERVLYEVFPLRELADARLAIAGAGDAAFDYALNLAKRNQVLILNRGAETKCLPLLWERSRATANIVYHSSTALERLEALSGGGLRLDCQGASGALSFEVDYLIGALGRTPRLELLSGIPDLHELESTGLLHRVGDARRGIFRQTAIAVGDGMLAAMQISQRLKEAA